MDVYGVILATFVGILFIALIISVAVIYGMELATNDKINNFIDWLKYEYRLSRDIAEETKAEKAYLKAHPLCIDCQKQGKYRKAKYCTASRKGEIVPVCSEHLQQRTHEELNTEKEKEG